MSSPAGTSRPGFSFAGKTGMREASFVTATSASSRDQKPNVPVLTCMFLIL